jgi:predicted ribosomally synthesized peptide with nif11-like leader
MSLEAAVQFAEKVATNEALLAQLRKDTEGKDEKAALAAVVALGKAQGLDFTGPEAIEVRTALTLKFKQESGEELSSEELSQVSGGNIGVFFTRGAYVGPGSLSDGNAWRSAPSDVWGRISSPFTASNFKSVFKGW